MAGSHESLDDRGERVEGEVREGGEYEVEVGGVGCLCRE